MRNGEGGSLQSVTRALRSLELIAEAGELGVTELGRRLDVHKATASRLAATLAERGFLERDPATERYRLGFGIVCLAGAAMASLDLVRTARPVLEDLAERTRETVNLGVLSGHAVVYLDQASGARSIVSVNWVGRRTPLHNTAAGKVLLAYMDQAERERCLGEALERSTPDTIVDPDVLREQLRTVLVRGYAQTLEELEEGLNAVAAPIRQADGAVVAAVSVSGPAFRMRSVDLPRVARLTVDAGTAVSHRLGYAERRRSAGG
ncbi:MAG TPA: IclR family transcriptional regulator [Actinomycetota bacterium]|nr:IclR family transcriptional regulator [Actinomycetota bacterium]